MRLNKDNERFVLYRRICGLFRFTIPSVSDVRNAVSTSEA